MTDASDLDHTLGDLPTGHGRPQAEPELTPGTMAAGRYRIEGLLGRGGAGTVYLAVDEHLDRRIALKVLAGGASAATELGREARVLAGLSHPNIVVLHELVLDEELCFAVTELLEGGSLAERVARSGPLDVAELLTLARQLCSGVALAHERGILHRDLKPGNVLYTTDRVAKIADFGLARTRESAAPLDGIGAGTLLYSAPEQLRNAAAATVASDVFSLAATLYFAATGDPPHSIRLGHVPAEVRAALETGLELEPDRRPASVLDFLARLETGRGRTATRHRGAAEHPGATVTLGDRIYALEGLLARGDSCDVHCARWLGPVSERAVVKVLRCLADADLLRREHRILKRLQSSGAQGAEHFVNLLPEPIAFDYLPGDGVGDRRPATAYRHRSGFVYSLEDVIRAHDRAAPTASGRPGMSGEVAVWVFKRLLELLSFVHRCGVVHGAVVPPHVLVHHRDHGAILVGWSVATEWSPLRSERTPAIPRAWKELYPESVLRDRHVAPADDIAMAARTVLRAAGELRSPFAELMAEAASGAHRDAWALVERVAKASRSAYGRPSFHPISLPTPKED